jgi:indoleamine 2,3-dioxygenase
MDMQYAYPDAPIFDVDSETGFMAPSEPQSRLPSQWEAWEATLDAAVGARLQLGDNPGLTEQEETESEQWRASVKMVCFTLLPVFHKALMRIGM